MASMGPTNWFLHGRKNLFGEMPGLSVSFLNGDDWHEQHGSEFAG